MRRTLAAASATLAAISLTVSGGPTHAAAASAQHSQAVAALRYLYSQQNADGSIAGAPGPTEDTIIGTADNGFDPHTLRRTPAGPSALDYLRAQTLLGNTDSTAGGTAKLILALFAAHEDPATFAPGVDLVAKLRSYGQSNGVFANPAKGEPTAFSQALAILASVAANKALPNHAAEWLLCAQLPDGGFSFTINGTSATTPPASCGDATSGSDSNTSSIALQALNAARESGANSMGKAYFSNTQNADGGFTYQPPGSSDPDSDSYVVQGLVAMGVDPLLVSRNGKNPLGNLDALQDSATGGYASPPSTAPDAFTTSQVPAALALDPYATVTTFAAESSPVTAAVPSSSPAPTARPQPTSGPPLGAAIPVPGTGSGPTTPNAFGLLVAGFSVLALAVCVSRRRWGRG